MPRPNPSRSLAVLALAGLAFSLAQTMIVPALGDMKERLGTDEAGIAWTLTGYLLAAAVATPVFGRLGDMFGKRRMLVISLGFFAAGCAVSALGSSLEVVVAGRVLQGVGGGIFPLCFGIIRDEFPRERVPASIGLISAILGIGGGVGLVLGGVLADAFSYHVLFWLGAAHGGDRRRGRGAGDPGVAGAHAGARRRARRGDPRRRARPAAVRDRRGQLVGLGERAGRSG